MLLQHRLTINNGHQTTTTTHNTTTEAIATGSQALRLAWANKGPRSHHTCLTPGATKHHSRLSTPGSITG